jgi:type II secretory pathway pseudopilin PulG
VVDCINVGVKTAMRRTPFNMIEVLLALGVIALGAVSVLALFPYGLASSRDSVAESFAGDSADQFLHWFAAQARANWPAYTPSATASTWLPAAKPVTTPASELTSSPWAPAQYIPPNLTYRPCNTAGVLAVTFQRGDNTQPIVDFSGVYRIWREPVRVPYLTVAGTSSETTLAVDVAAAINLEASWPAALPYERRQKAIYRLEVFRPGS